jgi:hypothetical protein
MWIEALLSRHSEGWTVGRYEWAVAPGRSSKGGIRNVPVSLTADEFAGSCPGGANLGREGFLVIEVAALRPDDVGRLREWLRLGIPDELVDRAAMFCLDPDLPNSQAAVQLEISEPNDVSETMEVQGERTVEVRRIFFPGIVVGEGTMALLVRRARVLQSGSLCIVIWESATADPGHLALPTGAPEPSTEVDPGKIPLPSDQELLERRQFWTLFDKWVFEPGMLVARRLPGNPGSGLPATASDAAEDYVLQAASSSVSAVNRLKELADGFEIDALAAATDGGDSRLSRADTAQLAARLLRIATSLRRLVRWMDSATAEEPARWFDGASSHGAQIRSQLDRAYQGAREVAQDVKDLLPALDAIAEGSRPSPEDI